MKSQAILPLNKGLKKRVFVGLSGGVDSSVSAALLQKAGYEVTGVFIKVWQPDWLECTWKEERRDAMRVAAHLDIPFITLDLEKEYKRDVVDYMIAEYKAGNTPNPDVMCNRTVKFGAFYDWAMKNGADYVATGHYAQIKKNPGSKPKTISNDIDQMTNRVQSSKKDTNYFLTAGTDSNKDQSYFLWSLKQKQLEHILFPVGHLTKPEVRKLAKKFRLPTAEKKDSQGICFIGMVDMKTFLSHYIESKNGDVLDETGKVVGRHSGAVFFTIGERRGFTISNKSPHDEAYYVSSKDIENNSITVRHQRSGVSSDKTSSDDKIRIAQTNWIGEFPILGKKYQARCRYRQTLEPINFLEIDQKKSTAVVEFESLSTPVASGQSLVIYDQDICLGGGVIMNR